MTILSSCAIRLAWLAIAACALTVNLEAGTGADLRLVDAVRNSNTAAVRALIKQRVDVNALQPDGSTALHWAVYQDDKELVELLIGAGARVNAANEFGATPLWVACTEGRASMMDRLLRAGADPNLALRTGETPLMTASRTGNVAAVKLLLVAGANVNARESSRSQTALMWAVSERHSQVAAMLVEFGADINSRTSVRRVLANSGADGTLRLTTDRADLFDEDQGGFTPLLFAARTGDPLSARLLLEKGANVNDMAPTGATALVVAAHSAQSSVAAVLLDRGADPNAAGAGYTALHAAILRGDADLVKLLLARGANPNAVITQSTPTRRNSQDWSIQPSFVGTTPIWLAAKFSDAPIMRVLAQGGADPRFAKNDGTSVLMAPLAAGPGRHGLVGAAPRDPKEVEREALEAVKIAVELGVDVNAPSATGDTALHAAVSRRLNSVVQFLAEHGAKLDVKNKRGQTPLALTRGGRGGASADTSTADLLRKLGATE